MILQPSFLPSTAQQQQNTRNINTNVETEDTPISLCNILQYSLKQKWITGVSSIDGHTPTSCDASTTLLDSTTLPQPLQDVLRSMCEEVELLARQVSNDEGGTSSVATGVPFAPETEHPDILIHRGMENSYIPHVDAPPFDWNHPVPEHMPGFFQKSFPFIFSTGDADPFQRRPVDIKSNKSSWEPDYLKWIAMQPEVQQCPVAQFYLRGRAERLASKHLVNIAIHNTGTDRYNLPTLQTLRDDPEARNELAGRVMSLGSEMKGSRASWRKESNNVTEACRYLADPPPYHEGAIPMELSLFQTRACDYNNDRHAHRLFPNSASIMARCEEQYHSARRANVLKHPSVIQLVHCIKSDLDTTVLTPAVQKSTLYWYRHEWGPNANPHIHRLVMINELNTLLHQWKQSVMNEIESIRTECGTYDLSTLPNDDLESKKTHHTNVVIGMWEDIRRRYCNWMEQMYTNWN